MGLFNFQPSNWATICIIQNVASSFDRLKLFLFHCSNGPAYLIFSTVLLVRPPHRTSLKAGPDWASEIIEMFNEGQ